MKKFYIEANKRNEVMTNNLLRNKDRSKVSALLVGGFHAQGIKDFLRARGIGYEVILPSIEGYDGKIYYEDRVREEALRLGLVEEDGANFGKDVKRREQNKLQLIDVFSTNGILSSDISGLEEKALEGKLREIIESKNFKKDELEEALNKYNEAKEILRKEAKKEGKEEIFTKLEEELDSNIDRILGKNKKGLFKRVIERLSKILNIKVNYFKENNEKDEFYEFLESKKIKNSIKIYDLYKKFKKEYSTLQKLDTKEIKDFLSKNLLTKLFPKDDDPVKNILINCCYNSLNKKEYLNGVDIFFKFLVYFLNKDIKIYYDKDNNFCLDMNLEDVEISQYLYIIFKDIDKKDEDFFKRKQNHLLFNKIKINLIGENIPSKFIDFKTIITPYKYNAELDIIPDIEIKINKSKSLISEKELGLYENNFWKDFNSKDKENKFIFILNNNFYKFHSIANSDYKIVSTLYENSSNLIKKMKEKKDEQLSHLLFFDEEKIFENKEAVNCLHKYKKVEGKNLFDHFNEFLKKKPEEKELKEEVNRIFIQILDILSYLEKNNLYWIDIKLSNFMIDKEGNVIAVDLDEVFHKKDLKIVIDNFHKKYRFARGTLICKEYYDNFNFKQIKLYENLFTINYQMYCIGVMLISILLSYYDCCLKDELRNVYTNNDINNIRKILVNLFSKDSKIKDENFLKIIEYCLFSSFVDSNISFDEIKNIFNIDNNNITKKEEINNEKQKENIYENISLLAENLKYFLKIFLPDDFVFKSVFLDYLNIFIEDGKIEKYLKKDEILKGFSYLNKFIKFYFLKFIKVEYDENEGIIDIDISNVNKEDEKELSQIIITMLSYLKTKADYKVKIKVKGIESLLNKSFIRLTEGFQYVIVESSEQTIGEMEKVLASKVNMFQKNGKSRFVLQDKGTKKFYKKSLSLERNQDNVKRFTELIEKNNAYSKCMLFPTKNIKDTLYVYEYIDGKDLFEYFYKFKDENPIIRINKSIPIFIKILEILNFINENGFLWTDIKLENFMITKNEDVVAIDLDEIQKKGSTSELLLYSYNYFNEKYLSEKYMLYCFIFMFINVISGFKLESLASNPENIEFFKKESLPALEKISSKLNQEGKNKILSFTNYLLEIFENNSESIDFSEIKLKLDELKLDELKEDIFIINNNYYKKTFYTKEDFNFLGHGNLFKEDTKVIDTKDEKSFFSKMKEKMKNFIDKAKIKTKKFIEESLLKAEKMREEKIQILSAFMSNYHEKLEKDFNSVEKLIGIDNLEFVEDEEFNLSSILDDKNGLKYRMTGNMAMFLDMIMSNKGNEKKLDLLAEVFCHENLEILSKDHEFAAEHAGEFQKFLIELFTDIEFKEAFKMLRNINEQKNLNLKDIGIDEINEKVMKIVDKFNQNKSGLRILARDIYDEFQNIKKEMIKNVTKSETYREIVLDINGMNLDAIKDKINALGLENKYKLRVVLVGDIKEKEKLENYLKMLKDINNPFIDIEAVLGKKLLVEIRNDAKLLDKYKNIVSAVTILGNGYILTASGNINESLYAEISKKLTEKNITINEKNIARSINAGFFGEEDFESIYKNFIENVDNKKLANNVRQFVIGMENELSKESLELLDCMVNKGNDNKNLNMIEVSENGLVVSREIEIDKFRENDLMNNEKVINVTSNEKILGTEKMVLEGIEGKNIDILRFGIIIKAKSIRLLSKIGLSKAIDGEKIKLSENVKSFASAA